MGLILRKWVSWMVTLRIGEKKEEPILAYYIRTCYFSVTTSCRQQALEEPYRVGGNLKSLSS